MKKNHKLPLSMVLSGGVLLLILLAALLAPLSPYDHRRGDRAEVPAPLRPAPAGNG